MSVAPTKTEDSRLIPFSLGRGNAAANVLLIHGFTGTPFEMRYLGGYLARRGFHAFGVRLPGHGLDPLALEQTGAMDWINEARAQLLALPADKPTFVAGLSMGALIASILAAEHPDRVAGLALCAPALRLRRSTEALLGLSSLGLLGSAVRFVTKRSAELRDPKMRARLPRLERIPVAAAVQFERVQAFARLALPRVTAPAMVLYSEADRTVAPAAAKELARLIGTRPVRLVRLEESSHVLTLDLERERVGQEIERFFRTLL
jgi:carboxylesterase